VAKRHSPSDEIPEMIASIESVKSGFCLTDITDHRYQYIASLKHRFGIFLHNASANLRQQGEENTVDAVEILVSAGPRLFFSEPHVI
jgi:proteasome activator subunit 4